MRRFLLLLIVAATIWEATSWTGIPQWKVIAENHQIGGSKPFIGSVMFTPSKSTAYRVTASCSATGDPESNWSFTFEWRDMAGKDAQASLSCTPSGFKITQQTVLVLTPRRGWPVTLSATLGSGPASYFGFYTVEELQ
jgi:hypothetical protein